MQAKIIDNRKIIYEFGQSFKYDSEISLDTPLHCHSEYELIYITKGHGKEFIGDSVRRYQTGDLILIGKNLPHLYLSDSYDGQRERDTNICSILQFPRSIFPDQMEEIQEYSFINSVLEKSIQGVLFHAKMSIRKVLKIMKLLSIQKGIDRILSLFMILNILGKSRDITIISTLKYSQPLDSYLPNDRISIIHSYLINNIKEEILLEDIAEQVKMNTVSLCRYFKQKTGKTIFQRLNEIRVEYACKLLANSNHTVAQIAYDSGFNNQSHFNKQFKIITKYTPTEYRDIFAV